jgi:hypothetical protein
MSSRGVLTQRDHQEIFAEVLGSMNPGDAQGRQIDGKQTTIYMTNRELAKFSPTFVSGAVRRQYYVTLEANLPTNLSHCSNTMVEQVSGANV